MGSQEEAVQKEPEGRRWLCRDVRVPTLSALESIALCHDREVETERVTCPVTSV